MADVLGNIFTDQAVRRLRKHALNSPCAAFHYRVLSLGQDSHPFTRRPDVFGDEPFLEVRRRWNRWIAAGVSSGLLDQPHGAELGSRLTGIDDDGFRSALAECMVCWALTAELGLQMRPRPAGRDHRVLEFAAETLEGEVNFEVKSPRPYRSDRPGPATEIANDALEKYWAAVSIGAALRSANRQFVRSQRNILIIALPYIGEAPAGSRTGEWSSALIRALYGEAYSVDSPAGPPASGFFEGNFVRCLDGKPRFTRVSAAIALQDSCGANQMRATVLHNPYSEKPVDARIFREWKQFGRGDGAMGVLINESTTVD